MVVDSVSDQDSLLNEGEAAGSLAVSVRTLQAWRTKGIGPPFVRLGRAIRYSRRALIDWVHANTHATS
ncbi:MAG TPA: helix-turn-helix domain-containing protein [Pseudolabrys sp.]|nr:helix-turn-helix domain-containing protein [Pseudolabrys sp.]